MVGEKLLGHRRQVWLRSNRRAVAVAASIPLAGLTVAVFLLAASAWWIKLLGGLLLLGSALVAVSLAVVWYTPLLAVEDGVLLVHLGWTAPQRVPLDAVECIFLGHQQADLPGTDGRLAKCKAVVIRLAESAQDYHHRPVRPSLGQWRDGYITIGGTWCEPITAELLQSMNARLREFHMHRRAAQKAQGPNTLATNPTCNHGVDK